MSKSGNKSPTDDFAAFAGPGYSAAPNAEPAKQAMSSSSSSSSLAYPEGYDPVKESSRLVSFFLF